MSAIVVTGAGGFVGGRLVRLLLSCGATVIGIGRGEEPSDWPVGARWLQADLAVPDKYEAALAGAACVVHLAAITGKARPEDFQRGNVEATRVLLDACARAAVGRFVFVSSIAVTFADRRYYAYAESKIAAEALVRQAPLASVIVRPTMILGPGSPIEESLAKLACLPVAPLFGDGRRQVQPVDVEDVAELLANLAQGAEAGEGPLEVGGPEVYDLRGLYARLRAVHGAGAPRFLRLPLGLFQFALAIVEKPLLPLLPLTAGQLASFANDGVAAPHPALRQLLPNPRPAPAPRLPTTDAGGAGPGAPESTDPARAAMGPSEGAALDAEFTRHARHVAGPTPTPYQMAKYRDCHARRHGLVPRNAFDALLLRLARTGRIGLALADCYSGLLYRRAVVRAKLVLALAILETSPPSHAALDAPDRHALAAMACRGAAAAFGFGVAVLLLAPLHLLFALGGRLRPAR